MKYFLGIVTCLHSLILTQNSDQFSGGRSSIVLGLIILLGYLFIKETLFLISGLILIAFGIVPALREVGLQGQRKKEYQNWKQGIQNYEKAVEVWNLEVELWKELYYCARDDSVFVLGANKFASSSHVTEYVRNLQDNKIKLVLTAKQQKPLAQDDSQSSQAVSIAPWIVLILVLGVCLGGAILLAVLYK